MSSSRHMPGAPGVMEVPAFTCLVLTHVNIFEGPVLLTSSQEGQKYVVITPHKSAL